MDKVILRKNIKVIEEWLDNPNLVVELRCNEMDSWDELPIPNFANPAVYNYRIRPTPKLLPWTFETCPRSGWVRHKQNDVGRILGLAGAAIEKHRIVAQHEIYYLDLLEYRGTRLLCLPKEVNHYLQVYYRLFLET